MNSNRDSISIGNIKDVDSILNQTLNRFFETYLESNPEKLHQLAVKDADKEDTQVTFDQLNKKSNQVARSLVNRVGRNVKGIKNSSNTLHFAIYKISFYLLQYNQCYL